MFLGKGALASHVLIIVVLGFGFSLLLVFLLDFTHINDPVECQDLEGTFELSICRDGPNYKLEIENKGDFVLEFEINGVRDTTYRTSPDEENRVLFRTEEYDSLSLIPVVNTQSGESLCKARGINHASLNTIRKC